MLLTSVTGNPLLDLMYMSILVKLAQISYELSPEMGVSVANDYRLQLSKMIRTISYRPSYKRDSEMRSLLEENGRLKLSSLLVVASSAAVTPKMNPNPLQEEMKPCNKATTTITTTGEYHRPLLQY